MARMLRYVSRDKDLKPAPREGNHRQALLGGKENGFQRV